MKESTKQRKIYTMYNTSVRYTNDYKFSARAHRGRLQRPLQSLHKGKKDCRSEERGLFSRAIFCVYRFSTPRRKTRAPFKHVSDFDRGRIVAYRGCGLSFREIGHRIGRSQVTVMRIWNRWMQEGTTDRQERLQPPRHTHRIPKIFDRAFNLFKPVIRMTSLERIFIADKASTKDLLLKYIDENVLPAFLGGSRVDSKGDPECKEFITFGGKVPEKFYLKNCRIPLSPSDPNVKCMTVRARSMKNVSCVVKEAKTKIRFQLKSENGSIYFSVLYREFGPNPDDIELPEEDEYLDETADNFKYKQISVELRVQAHCAQEDLTTILPWPGIYVVRLNNSSNWFTSRKLMVKLESFPPSKEAK